MRCVISFYVQASSHRAGTKANPPTSTPGLRGRKCDDFPEKFQQLARFFDDLGSDFGREDLFDALGTDCLIDIFIVCVR